MIKDIVDENADKDINAEKIAKLKEIIPNCFDKSGKLDMELLKEEFKDDLDYTKESYELNFLGKSYAKMIAGLDTETVIEPDTEHNEKEENKNSENIYISGDNLDALKHLVKAKGYEGHIKCIYIDPPYNTGSDGFIYNDNFKFDKVSLMDKLDIDENEAERILNMTSGKSSTHSAWLTFMYPRLYLAKQLLSDDGVIFISIDDNEQADLKLLCGSIFGEENFLAQVIWERAFSPVNLMKHFSPSHDYILCYAKNIESATCNGIKRSDETNDRYSNPDNDPRGVWSSSDISVGPAVQENIYPITTPSGRVVEPPAGRSWSLSKKAFLERLRDNRIWFGPDGNGVPRIKRFLSELRKTGVTPMTIWKYTEVDHSQGATQKLAKLFDGKKVFDYPKPVDLIERCLQLYSSDDCYILDFFSGSATTAQAVMQLNAEDGGCRRYIMVQLPEKTKENSQAQKSGYNTIDEIGQERIKRAAKQIKEETGADIDYGFKHYTLRDTPEDLLHTMEEFNPDLLINDSMDLYKEYGIETILETWKLKDGYKFTDTVEKVDLDGYTAYRCGECIYFIEPHIGIDNINALLQKYSGEGDFTCNKVVIFGYSFMFNELEMIKNNIKQVKNTTNIDVRAYTRY